MAEETRPTNVVQALARVAGEIGAIGKDLTSPANTGAYKYRGIEQITEKAQRLFAEYGVVFAPMVEKIETREITVNAKPWTDTTLTVLYTIYGPSFSPGQAGEPGTDDWINVRTVGIGRDGSDKGANKAMTQAFKYALIQVLCVSDAKDDQDGDSSKEREASTRAQAEQSLEQAEGEQVVPTEEPRTWAHVNAMLNAWGEGFRETWGMFGTQACAALFNGETDTKKLSPELRSELLKANIAAVIELRRIHPAATLPTEEEAQAAWKAILPTCEFESIPF